MDIISRKDAKAQGLKHYFTGKPCKRGHVELRLVSSEGCMACAADKARNRYHSVLKHDPAYRAAAVVKMANWRVNNPELQLEISRRATAKIEAGSQEHFASRLRCLVKNTIVRGSGTKASKTTALLGCEVNVAREHIESLFVEGMSWGNYGRNGWHIDHIRPCLSFDMSQEVQQRVCLNWRNLQPLWEAENIAKSDTWTPAMEAEWAANMRAMGFKGDLFLAFEQVAAA